VFRVFCLLFILFLVLLPGSVCSQFSDRANPFPGAGAEPDTSFNEADTIINKAALYSLIIPGGGQIYNKKWWKVPLAVGIDVGTTSWLIYTRSNYKSSQVAYEKAISENTPTSRLKQQRDFYRKQSEYAWIVVLVGHIVTVADAYVDRHMMTFDVSDDLTMQRSYQYPIENQSVLKAGFVFNLNNLSKQRTPGFAMSMR
jgi:hypothetical protein